MTDYDAALLRAKKLSEDTGLSLAEILDLPMSDYARLTGRPTPVESAVQSLETDVPGTPRTDPRPAEPAPPQEDVSESPGVDIASMDMQTYAEFRAQAGIGQGRQEGKGIFDSVGSRSQGYTDATRAQTGRTAYSNGNVEQAPRLTGRTVLDHDEMRDTRTASQRFGTPGNSFQIS